MSTYFPVFFRPEAFTHMTMIHRLSIGKLHNLVFVQEFLNLIDYQMNHLNACIFCEHMFPSQPILKKHCRNSKHHFRIKPDNHKYDKYYIVNYLPKDKKRTDDDCFSSDDYYAASSVASHGFDDQEDAEEATWADWDEPLLETEPVQCLFDDIICPNIDALLEGHLKEAHHFDLYAYFDKHRLDFYDKIKLINYMRLEVAQTRCFACGHQAESLQLLQQHFSKMPLEHLMELPSPDTEAWKNPQYLLPVNENDPLLRVLETSFDDE